MQATPSQVTLLFSSYLGVQVLAMLFTGACAARFGAKRTLVGGLALIVAATLACALASSITELVSLRAVWGLGNAFFIATALSVIVGAASGGQQGAILLYEAALGIGLSTGPLLGAALAYAALLALMLVPDKPVLAVAVILSGVVSGLLNTLFTGAAMSISPAPRAVASGGYNFLRWLGGAAAGTWPSGSAGRTPRSWSARCSACWPVACSRWARTNRTPRWFRSKRPSSARNSSGCSQCADHGR